MSNKVNKTYPFIFRRIMLNQLYFSKIYTLEEIRIDTNKEILEMKTSLLKKVNFPFDINAVETIVYKKLSNGQT
jgi:hypothetical protein